jgi:enamine deaminase RidA (YjgF/YER057c/UK114 family)
MISPEDRIAELDLELPEATTPVAAFVPTVQTGELMFVSGQIATAADGLVASGRLGAELDVAAGQKCARQCALNLLAQLKAALGTLARVHQVVKLTIFVASDPSFVEQHLVANGASDLLNDVFGSAGVHSRSAIGVTALPFGSPVEVEAVVEVGR